MAGAGCGALLVGFRLRPLSRAPLVQPPRRAGTGIEPRCRSRCRAGLTSTVGQVCKLKVLEFHRELTVALFDVCRDDIRLPACGSPVVARVHDAVELRAVIGLRVVIGPLEGTDSSAVAFAGEHPGFVRLFLADPGQLVFWGGLRDVIIDACLISNGRCRQWVIAGHHDGFDAHLAQFGDVFR